MDSVSECRKRSIHDVTNPTRNEKLGKKPRIGGVNTEDAFTKIPRELLEVIVECLDFHGLAGMARCSRAWNLRVRNAKIYKQILSACKIPVQPHPKILKLRATPLQLITFAENVHEFGLPTPAKVRYLLSILKKTFPISRPNTLQLRARRLRGMLHYAEVPKTQSDREIYRLFNSIYWQTETAYPNFRQRVAMEIARMAADGRLPDAGTGLQDICTQLSVVTLDHKPRDLFRLLAVHKTTKPSTQMRAKHLSAFLHLYEQPDSTMDRQAFDDMTKTLKSNLLPATWVPESSYYRAVLGVPDRGNRTTFDEALTAVEQCLVTIPPASPIHMEARLWTAHAQARNAISRLGDGGACSIFDIARIHPTSHFLTKVSATIEMAKMRLSDRVTDAQLSFERTDTLLNALILEPDLTPEDSQGIDFLQIRLRHKHHLSRASDRDTDIRAEKLAADYPQTELALLVLFIRADMQAWDRCNRLSDAMAVQYLREVLSEAPFSQTRHPLAALALGRLHYMYRTTVLSDDTIADLLAWAETHPKMPPHMLGWCIYYRAALCVENRIPGKLSDGNATTLLHSLGSHPDALLRTLALYHLAILRYKRRTLAITLDHAKQILTAAHINPRLPKNIRDQAKRWTG